MVAIITIITQIIIMIILLQHKVIVMQWIGDFLVKNSLS